MFEKEGEIDDEYVSDGILTHPQSYKYLIPNTPQAYAPLKLFVNEMNIKDEDFGDLQNLDTLTTEDLSTRVNVMNTFFKEKMIVSLSNLVKEGSAVGREATKCIQILEKI